MQYVDWFAGTSAAIQFCLALLGIAVSLQEDRAKRHRWLLLISFAILGIGGVLITMAQSVKTGKEAAISSAQLKTSLDNLNSSTQETNRVTTLNTQLQQKLLEQSATITDLSKQGISTATGGNSFCYMIFSTDQLSVAAAIPTFVQVGKYPLTDLDARILNLDDFNKMAQGNVGLEQMLNAGTRITLGNLSFGTVLINPEWKIPLSDNFNYRIFFAAKNGFWIEDFEVRRVNGKRVEALRVRRQTGNKTPTIFQKIDNDFPRVQKSVEWPN